MPSYLRTKTGIAICPYFIWQSENIEGLGHREDDVTLIFCNHPKNQCDSEGNCQENWCPLIEQKKSKEKQNELSTD